MSGERQPEDAAPVEVGDVLAEKYRVERVLGIGGMGAVVAATHLDLNEMRALKFMLPSVSANAETTARFLREARAVARLDSEYVAKIHDMGRLEHGEPYLVMEYLEGEDLKALLARRKRLPVADAVRYTLQALVGLAEAHANGIVHRDLKPPNLFISKSRDGLSRVKLLDFGVSKLTGYDIPELDKTRTNAMLGSPYYMSPEQMEATNAVDVRTDIWSIGVILYEVLVGDVPFEAPSITALSIKVVQHTPPSIATLCKDVPEALNAVVMRCLEKHAADRYADVAELAEALAPFAAQDARGLARHARRILEAAGRAEKEAVADVATDDSELGPSRASEPTRIVTGATTKQKQKKKKRRAKKAGAATGKAARGKLDGVKTASSWEASRPDAMRRPRTLIIAAVGGALAMAAVFALIADDDAVESDTPAAAESVHADLEPSAPSEPSASAAPALSAPPEVSAAPAASTSAEVDAGAAAASASASASATAPAPMPRRRRRATDIYDSLDKPPDDPYEGLAKPKPKPKPWTPQDL
jgi:serine/threonine-protein kinase